MDEEKKGDCPNCRVSDETIQKLKDSANKKTEYESKKQNKEMQMALKVRSKKAKKIAFWAVGILVAGGLIFAGFGYFSQKQEDGIKATVYYSPTCSCCKEYITYLRSKGFDVETKSTNNMLAIKEKYNIPSSVESCHTTVVGNYFIEGHMPIQFINKLLDEKPEISGIALPGMPQGSPGMPGIKGSNIKIFSLNNGVSSEFASW